jgi:hypothetical protein
MHFSFHRPLIAIRHNLQEERTSKTDLVAKVLAQVQLACLVPLQLQHQLVLSPVVLRDQITSWVEGKQILPSMIMPLEVCMEAKFKQVTMVLVVPRVINWWQGRDLTG